MKVDLGSPGGRVQFGGSDQECSWSWMVGRIGLAVAWRLETGLFTLWWTDYSPPASDRETHQAALPMEATFDIRTAMRQVVPYIESEAWAAVAGLRPVHQCDRCGQNIYLGQGMVKPIDGDAKGQSWCIQCRDDAPEVITMRWAGYAKEAQ